MNSTTVLVTTLFGAVYNCNTYGNSGTYGIGEECTTAPTNPTNPGTPVTGGNTGTSGGVATTAGTTGAGTGLPATGSPMFIALASGVLLVVIALSVIVFKVVRSRQSAK